MEPHLAGKLFCHELRYTIQLQHIQVRVCSDHVLSKTIGTDDFVTHDPTPNIPFRRIPLVFNYDMRIFQPPDATTVTVYTIVYFLSYGGQPTSSQVKQGTGK